MDSLGESYSSSGVETERNRDDIPNSPHPEERAQINLESRPSSDRELDIPDSQSQALRQTQNSVSWSPLACVPVISIAHRARIYLVVLLSSAVGALSIPTLFGTVAWGVDWFVTLHAL